MKYSIFFVACLLIIAAVAYPETAKQDYADVSWGMTLPELVARGVTEQADKRLFRQRQYHGFDMSEEFKLDGGLLTKIILVTSVTAWQYLTNDLYVKYGAPAHKGKYSVEWETPRASATVLMGPNSSVGVVMSCAADLSAIRNKVFTNGSGL